MRWPKRGLARRFILGAVILGAVVGVSYITSGWRKQHINATGKRLDAYSTAEYARLLRAHVDGRDGFVDYAALQRDDHDALLRYLDGVARFGPDTTPEAFPNQHDALAFYLNAYNAIMLEQILRHDIPASVPRVGFRTDQWRVDGQWITLDRLEQGLIRPVFKEPRVHFALVCAAIDCPPLRNEPYDGKRLEAQLDDQARRFFAEDKGVKVDAEVVTLSKILDWYRKDFDGVGGLKSTLLKYMNEADPRRSAVEKTAESGFRFRPYDWTVNNRAKR